MIFGQALQVIFQGINTSGSEETALPHSTSHYLAYPSSFFDQFFVSKQDTTHRASETFTQADRNAVKKFAVLFWCFPGSRQCIEYTCPVKVKFQVVFFADIMD